MRERRFLAVLLAFACLGFLLAPPAVAEDSGDTTVANAVLRWGLSNEANNSAFAPGTYNFFSAGKVPDPGRGGTTLKQADWRQAAGQVSLEKWNGSAWRAATWAGLSTASDGSSLGSPTTAKFSNHQVVLSAGTGTVDREAGTARISWTGDFTVLLYSGMSFFYVSDPVLEVADGVGHLTGTLSGFAASQTDSSRWEKVPAHEVTLADLPGVELGEGGFTSSPAYAGVAVTGVGQQSGGSSYGSFPQSWVDFMDLIGTAAYWCSTGASTDAFKPALPVTVSYGVGLAAPTPAAQPSSPTPLNVAPTPPAVEESEAPTVTTASAPVVTASGLPAPSAARPSAAVVAAAQPVVAQPVRLTAAHVRPAPSAVAHPDRPWWTAGGALLALALLLTLATLFRPRLFLPRPDQPDPRG